MFRVYLFTLAYIIYFLADIFPSYKRKEWSSFLLCTFITLISYMVTVFILLGIDVSSPSKPIKDLVKAIIGS